jgi:hypothetical protein
MIVAKARSEKADDTTIPRQQHPLLSYRHTGKKASEGFITFIVYYLLSMTYTHIAFQMD